MSSSSVDLERASRVIAGIAKVSNVTPWENAPGGTKPYAEGSGEDKKDKRTGIAMAWEANNAVDTCSKEPPTPMLNQDGGSQP